jgi:hypothetical protein
MGPCLLRLLAHFKQRCDFGHLNRAEEQAAEQLGIRELISKPFDLGELSCVRHRIFSNDLASQKT